MDRLHELLLPVQREILTIVGRLGGLDKYSRGYFAVLAQAGYALKIEGEPLNTWTV